MIADGVPFCKEESRFCFIAMMILFLGIKPVTKPGAVGELGGRRTGMG